MGIFSPTDVICELDRLLVRDDGEATGGSEPYLWSIFFKLDGDSVTAAIDINDNGVSLRLDGEPFVDSPDEGSHGNLQLKDDTVRAGGLFEPEKKLVNIPSDVGRFKTTLRPIPTTVNIDPDSWVADLIGDISLRVIDIVDAVSGGEQCPSWEEEEPGQLVGQFSAEFLTWTVGGLPGAFGAVYILMEEDGTPEHSVESGRRALRDRFREELQETIMPAISFANQAPSDATMEEIEIRLTEAITDAIVAGTEWWEWLTILPLDTDDALGSAQAMMSHAAVVSASLSGEAQEIDEDFLAPDGNGDWSMRGSIGPAPLIEE